MKNNDIERELKNAFQKIAPDQLDMILSECEKQERKAVYVEGNNKYKWVPKLAGSLAVFVFALTLVLGSAALLGNNKAVATIALDVNPSIEIKIDRNEKVLEVDALNEDAKLIMGDMDFRGTDLRVTVNSLIGSLVQHGYISDLHNSVLISVSGDNAQENKFLEEKLFIEIASLLENGSVMSQQVEADKTVKELAEKYGISLGKAQLIRELADNTGLYTYDDLASLSINELNLLNKKTDDSIIQRSGKPSDKAYIGLENAIRIALEHAGTDSTKTYIDEAGLDTEKGRMVYEVEFHYEDMEYEYTIDASSGEILKVEEEVYDGKHSDDEIANSIPPVDDVISQSEAKQIALKHAGISESQTAYIRIELEFDDGILKYDIEFRVGNTEYEYDIDARTGAMLSAEKETESEDDRYDD